MRHVAKLSACLALLVSAASQAIVPPESGPSSLADKAFFKPELYIPISNTPLHEAQAQMSSLSASAWEDFFARNGKDFNVYVDPRTGAATSVQGALPLIPGTGVGNNVTLQSLHQQLGRAVAQVDAAVVGDLIVKFIAENSAALGVDPLQLGEPRVTQVTDYLWMIHVPQQFNGVPVRHARVAAVINHGNLILLGTEAWARPDVDTRPAVTPEQALAFGGDTLGLYETPTNLWQSPTLEIAPLARADSQNGQSFIGTFGQGYEHRLVWTYGFQRPGELERWKVTVDAHTGETLAAEDDNHYLDATIKGGVYPSTNIETCASNEVCGTMQPDTPMPWANTGFASPNNLTDGAGVYNYTSGTATTTLDGKYVRINDNCGSVSFSSSSGNINMGGVNGNHDCVTGGGGAGNTASARSCFYEINKLSEQARGWLPTNTWLQGKLTANVNINSTCNAFWNGSTINFYRSGGGCRNTGEIGAVFDHEWGHGMDDFDANGSLSNSSEAYADIAAIYRLQTSCIGYGFFHTSNRGCGLTPDGTGYNQNESQVSGQPWCNTECSGVRDADWAKHVANTPATPQNFVCSKCTSSSGPCGRQVHCAAAPSRQAAWDLVARDLRAAPFNYDSNTAFLVGNKVFYQGSGNIGTWHACNCTGGTSDGCGATNGYMSWLAADDDNGNLSDGTPHMTAIYNAFNRHNIACSTPAPVNSGCASGPSTAPAASATPGDGQVSLNWTASTGANQYWVMKTEGFAGCDFGKAKIATVTGTSYTDGEVANGRQYCYSIVAASSNACYSPGSTCVCATPACASPTTPSLVSPANGATGVAYAAVLDWSDVTGTTYEVQVATDSAFTNVVASASGLGASTWTVSPALNASTTYYWRVRTASSCGGTSAWSSARSFTTVGCTTLAAPTLSSPANGATGVSASAALDWSDVTGAATYDVQVATDSAFTNVVRSGTSLAASAWTVSPALSTNTTYYWRARAANSCGAGAYSSARSFTTANVCTLLAATYNATNKAPTCAAGCGCDTGTTLINGRGTMSGGNESNRPNTLGGTCADGNSGSYHYDESIDRMTIKSTDESTLTPGKQVTVEVTAWCYSSADKLDLYYTTNVASPSWTTLATSLSCPSARGVYTFSRTFTLNSTATGQQAVRAQLRYNGSAGTCTSGSYNDRDDLVFTVSSSIAQATPIKGETQGRKAASR